MKACRICRLESKNLEHLESIREGLQISTIVMIICPIVIKSEDVLPKFICDECLSIIMKAYKLRSKSLKSENYFITQIGQKECDEWYSDEEIDESVIRIKEENMEFFAEPLEIYDVGPESTNRSYERQLKTQVDETYSVELHRKSMRSKAWDYFGRLVDEEGNVVEDEEGYFFCKICVQEKRANRYKNDRISTGMIFQHLKKAHEIDAERSKDLAKPVFKKDKQKPIPTGLTFACNEEGCDKWYKIKICLEIHKGLEHTGIADQEPSFHEYSVDLSQKKNKNSMAWKYFGILVNNKNEIVDENHYYCRLCVNVGNLNFKYVKTCSTTTLLFHVRDLHLENKKKRKRFTGEDD